MCSTSLNTQLLFSFILCFINCFLSLELPYNVSNPYPINSNECIRIATQSCNYQYFHPNKFWSYMVVSLPDMVTLLGDTVYLDAKPCNDEKENCKSMWDVACDVNDCNNATDLTCFNYCWSAQDWYTHPLTEYNYLLNDSDFTLNKKYDNYNNWPVPIVAIWDDHDYCMDNAKENCTYENLTRDAYVYFIEQIDLKGSFTADLKYLDEHKDSGIYYMYDYDKEIDGNDKLKLRFYNFDVRWYRTENDILGEEQRLWFEDLLFNHSIEDIDYHIICSGSTYYTNFGIGSSFAEPWPEDSKKWFENVTSAANIRDRLLIFTGDVHYSAIYRDVKTFEIVTSAMTHGIAAVQGIYLETVQDPHDYLVTDIITEENIGLVDLRKDAFQVIYINDAGKIIGNFTYNYTSDNLTWHSKAFYLNINWNILIGLLLFYIIV